MKILKWYVKQRIQNLTLSEGELGVAIDGDVVIIIAHDKLA